MKLKLKPTVLLCSVQCAVCASAYANEVVELDAVTVSGKLEHQAGYINQFNQNSEAGSKLDLTVRETPASVEIINAKTMKERGDSTVISAVTKAAGITGGFSGHGTTGSYSVRGFAGYPGVDFLHDGIKLNGTMFSKRTLDVSNLDRIEIIKGASSVLNGEGSIGATVNLITKKPSFNEKGVEFGFKTGSYNSYGLNFGLGGVAIEDTLAYRVDAFTRRMGTNFDGEQRNLNSFSASLLYKINNNLLTSLSIEKSKDDARNDYQGTPLVNGKLNRSVRSISYNNLIDGVDSGDSLWLKHGIEWYPTLNMEVKNQLYYQNSSANIRRLYLAAPDTANPSMVNRAGYDSSQKQSLIGNRLDLTTRGNLFGLNNRFLVGIDASRLKLKRDQSTFASRTLATPMYRPERLYYRDFFTSTLHDYKKPDADIKLNQIGLYVEDQLSFTDRLKLVGGLRYDTYDIEYDFKKGGLSSPVAQKINKKHNKLSYRGGLVFDVTDATTLYASYASSFEPSDPSASFLTVNAAQTQLDLTKAKQYEVGLRHSFWEGNAEFTASAYHITKKNMLVSNPTPGAGLLNVGQQTAKGIEMALGLKPTEKLQIDANVSYVDSKYNDFVHNGVDYSGKTPASVPKYVANLGIRYMPVADMGIGLWIRHVGSFYTEHIGFSNSVKLPSYTIADLTFDYTYKKNTTFSFQLENLTNKIYATTARRDNQVFLGNGRGFKFSVTHRF